jgi:hypothetical protein
MSARTQNSSLFLALVVGTNDIDQLETWLSELIENQNDYENMEEGYMKKEQSNINLNIEDIYLKSSIAEIIESPKKELHGLEGWSKSLSDILNNTDIINNTEIINNTDIINNNSEISIRTPPRTTYRRDSSTRILGSKDRVISSKDITKSKRKPPPIPISLPVVSINLSELDSSDTMTYTTMESIVKPSKLGNYLSMYLFSYLFNYLSIYLYILVTSPITPIEPVSSIKDAKSQSLQRMVKRSKSLLLNNDKSQKLVSSPEIIRKPRTRNPQFANLASITGSNVSSSLKVINSNTDIKTSGNSKSNSNSSRDKEISNKPAKFNSIQSINSRRNLITNDNKICPSPSKPSVNISKSNEKESLHSFIDASPLTKPSLTKEYKHISPLPTSKSISISGGSSGFSPKSFELIKQASSRQTSSGSKLAVNTKNSPMKSVANLNSPTRLRKNFELERSKSLLSSTPLMPSRLSTSPTEEILNIKIPNQSKLDEILRTRSTRTRPIIGKKTGNLNIFINFYL